MKVLLTGASGLLGANLAHLLCARGVKPRLLLRERSDRRGLRGLTYEEALGDILDRASLDQAMKDVTHVYHVAGLVRLDQGGERELKRVNVDGTRNVLEAAKRAGVERVVYVSSTATVGYGPLSQPATEETPYNFEGRNAYNESKREAEALVLATPGMQVVVANPSLVVGAYDSRPSTGELLLAIANGLLQLYPSGGNNFVNAMDVADGLARAMERGHPSERYILGGDNLTFLQFMTLCAEEAGVSPPRLPAPETLLRGAGWLADRLSHLSPVFRFMNASSIASMFRGAYYSSDKATRDLGYRPGSIRAGIREAYRWFQEEGMFPRDRPLSPRGVVRA